MIEFHHVTKRYESGFEALKNVSLRLDDGQMAFLTGHSGAGKSTLLKIIALIEKPTRGQALLNRVNLRVPIFPVKGYSLTVPITNPDAAPVSTVTCS